MTKKDQTQIAVTSGLILLLVIIIFVQMAKFRKKHPRVQRPKPTEVAQPVATPASVPSAYAAASRARQGEEEAPPPEEFVCTEPGYRCLKDEAKAIPLDRDPFSLKKIKTSEEAGNEPARIQLELVGIAWSPANPKAIVNNKIVQKGSRIGNYTVTEILEDKVVLVDGEEVIELLLEL